MGRGPGLAKNLETIEDKEYNSPAVLTPKKQLVKNKYLKIYFDYVTHPQTEAELAKKHNMSLAYVSRIIKWAVIELRNQEPGPEDFRRIEIDKLTVQLQRLETIMGEADGVREKVAVQAEIRRTMKLVSQMRKLLINAVTIDMSRSQTVEMHTAEGFDRRTGAPDHEDVVDVQAEVLSNA